MHILLCTNGRKHSNEAIRFAGQLFYVEDPDVTLLHVVVPENATQFKEKKQEQQILQEGVKLLKEVGIQKVNFKLHHAKDIASSIIEETKRGEYDLLVMGSRGASDIIPGVSQYILGDIPRDVILHTDMSILTVPEPKPLEKILIGVDGSGATQGILEFWGSLESKHRKEEASWRSHRIILLNVIPELYERFSDLLGSFVENQLETLQTLPGKRTQYLYDAKEVLKKYDIDAQIRLREGDVAEEILKESERDYDLLIMRKSSRKKYVLGPYSKRVLEKSKIPVLLLKE